MKLRILVATAFFCAPLISNAANQAEIQAKVEKLNQESLKVLGISLNALRYLVDASPESYRPVWYLERTGDIKYIHELEQAGFVSTEIRTGLPDGTEQNEKFLRLIPSGTRGSSQPKMIGERLKLFCSFCGKSEDAVKKLVSGPNNACICDGSISAIGRIMDDTPNG